MEEPSVIDAVMRQTVAWVREEGTLARMKPVPVSHFVNGLGVASRVIDLLVAQRQEAMLLLVAEGVRPEKVLSAYAGTGEDAETLDELYPIDEAEFQISVENLDDRARELYEGEREVGDSSWYNIGPGVRRAYKRKVILGGEGDGDGD